MIKRPRYQHSERSELHYWHIEKELSYRYFATKSRLLKIKNIGSFRQNMRECGDINRFEVIDPLGKNALESMSYMRI